MSAARAEAIARNLVDELDSARGEGESLPFLDAIEIRYLNEQMASEFTFRFSNGRTLHHRWYEQAWDRPAAYLSPHDLKALLDLIERAYIEFGDRALNRVRLRQYDGMEPIDMAAVVRHYNWREEARERKHRREMEAAHRRREAANRWFAGPDAFPFPLLPNYPLNPLRDRFERNDLFDAIRVFRGGPGRLNDYLAATGEILSNHTPQARKRGRALLLGNLSPKQRADYTATGYFDVKGGETGDTYRLFHGTHLNILRLRDKQGICVIPREKPMVYGDVLLSQKLAFELEEGKALKEARFFHSDPRTLEQWEMKAKNQQAAAMAKDGS